MPPVYCRKARSSGLISGGFPGQLSTPAQGRGEQDRPRDPPGLHHAHYVFHQKIYGHAPRPRQHVADLRRHGMLDLGIGNYLRQSVSAVLLDNNGLGAGILQLVLQLAGGIERVAVDGRVTGAEDAKQRNRVLQQIGHHERHPGSGLQFQSALQIGAEVARLPFQLGISDHVAQIDIGRERAEACHALVEDLSNRAVLLDVNFGRHSRRITFQPDIFHSFSSASGRLLNSSACGKRFLFTAEGLGLALALYKNDKIPAARHA